MEELPPFVRDERDALIDEVYEAFAEVSREGGVSWSQAAVTDAHGAWPLQPENDSRWQDLIDDSTWESSPGLGGFGFLDAVGFRYYLPVQMTRCVRNGCDQGNIPLSIHLESSKDAGPSGERKQWSLLDLRQRRCVKRFLQYMNVVNPSGCDDLSFSRWDVALDGYWKGVPDEDEPTVPRP